MQLTVTCFSKVLSQHQSLLPRAGVVLLPVVVTDEMLAGSYLVLVVRQQGQQRVQDLHVWKED